MNAEFARTPEKPSDDFEAGFRAVAELGVYGGTRRLEEMFQRLADVALPGDSEQHLEAERRYHAAFELFGKMRNGFRGTYTMLWSAHQALAEADANGMSVAPEDFLAMLTPIPPDFPGGTTETPISA